MFATCLHCHGALGANEEIESFPVGRALAFDAKRGRLWVICPRCARWNLSPIEERWEAVEWCERAYRDTPLRAATGEIGLARLRSGLEIVRIGAPLRPEFAAWRYGRVLSERRRGAWAQRSRQWIEDNPDITGFLRVAARFTFVPGLLVGYSVNGILEVQRGIERRAPIRGVRYSGREIELTVGHLDSMRMVRTGGDRWHLELLHAGGIAALPQEEALPLVGRLLTHVNSVGATPQQIAQAVTKLEHFGSAERLAAFAAQRCTEQDLPLVTAMGYEQRLALEMAAHEGSERRAMEGELAALALAWKEAEEIAAIADNLLVPAGLITKIRALAGRRGRSGAG